MAGTGVAIAVGVAVLGIGGAAIYLASRPSGPGTPGGVCPQGEVPTGPNGCMAGYQASGQPGCCSPSPGREVLAPPAQPGIPAPQGPGVLPGPTFELIYSSPSSPSPPPSAQTPLTTPAASLPIPPLTAGVPTASGRQQLGRPRAVAAAPSGWPWLDIFR